SRGAQTLLPTPDRLSGDLLLFTRQLNGQTVLAAWHGGRERRTYSLKLASLGVKWAALAATPSLFAGQDARVSVSGGYLHLSLPARDAAAFRVE
ncbi:glycosyl hydrolase, partial [Deinococcus sp. 12RED42]|nr:glycosyl hydrolase [Deinococcus sp. 12RED42]